MDVLLWGGGASPELTHMPKGGGWELECVPGGSRACQGQDPAGWIHAGLQVQCSFGSCGLTQ